MALALSGSVHVNASTTVVTTPTLNTLVANCYVLACIESNGGADVVTVKSGSGANFSLIKTGGPANNYVNLWALFSAAIFNDTVVVTQGGAGFCSVDAFGVKGSGQTALVWDAGSPVFSATDPFDITTVSPNTMAIACFRQTAAAAPTAGSGFTAISGADYLLTEYKLVPAAGVTSCTQAPAGTSGGDIAVAIPQAGSGGGGGGGSGITLAGAAGGVKYFASQTHSFTATGLNGGADFPANSFVVVEFFSHSASGDLIAPKIGGQVATNVYGSANGVYSMSVYILQVGSSGVPDTISSDNGDYYADLFFRAYILTGGVDPVPVLGGLLIANSTPSPITVPTGGVGLVAYGVDSSMSDGTTVVWTPPSETAPSDGFFRQNGAGLLATYNTSVAGAWSPNFFGTPTLDYKSAQSITFAFRPSVAPILAPVKGGTGSMMGI